MAPDDLVFLEASWTTSVWLPIMVVASSPAIVAVRCDDYAFEAGRRRLVRDSSAPRNSCPNHIPCLVVLLHTTRPDEHTSFPADKKEELRIVAEFVHVEQWSSQS
jgi:hypothetical protein